tara:strand:+ start:1474 stop:1641 length:168 start_codon:yes stop_codon:yes gene_type:complete
MNNDYNTPTIEASDNTKFMRLCRALRKAKLDPETQAQIIFDHMMNKPRYKGDLIP